MSPRMGRARSRRFTIPAKATASHTQRTVIDRSAGLSMIDQYLLQFQEAQAREHEMLFDSVLVLVFFSEFNSEFNQYYYFNG